MAIFFCDKAYLTIRGYSANRSDIVFKGGGEALHQRCFRCTALTRFANLTIDGFGLERTVPKTTGGGANVATGADEGSVYVSGGAGVCVAKANNTEVAAGSCVTNCAFKNCTAGTGGALYRCDSVDTLFEGCSFNYNTPKAYHSGGGAVYFGTHSNDVFRACYAYDFPSTNVGRGGAGVGGSYYGCLFTACSNYLGMAISGASNTKPSGAYASHCVFSNNNTTVQCLGVIYAGTAEDCLFCDNNAVVSYGLPHVAVTRRCVFTRNVCPSIISGDSYNSLVVSNFCSGTGGGTGISIYANLYNCTLVSNQINSGVQFVLGNGVAAYDCLLAGNRGGNDNLAYTGPVYTSTADRPLSDKVVRRDFTNDVHAIKAVRWGADPVWGIPNMPVGIKGRASIKGRGSNLMGDGTTPIWTANDVDYAGKPRLRDGTIVDIGCYAYDPLGLMLLLR